MADKDGNKLSKDFNLETPFANNSGFHVKGMANTDWGLKNRLSKIFNPETGKTVMLAFDHGYIMGATSGLERLDLVIPPLVQYVDVLMATRGALRATIPPHYDKGIALRCTAGSCVLNDDMSAEHIAVDIEDAIRMNATIMAIQCFVGSQGQERSLKNINDAINTGMRYGIPTLGVVAVGKEMERTSKYFLLTTRLLAEMGAHVIKTYYCEDFEQIVAACPVPIVVAGGKKIPESEALTLTYSAMRDGAAGVDMGRNVFQSEDPAAMIQAIANIVHKNYTDKEAYQYYLDTKK